MLRLAAASIALAAAASPAAAVVFSVDLASVELTGINGGDDVDLGGALILEFSSAGDLGPLANRYIQLYGGAEFGGPDLSIGAPAGAIWEPGGTIVSGGTDSTLLAVTIAAQTSGYEGSGDALLDGGPQLDTNWREAVVLQFDFAELAALEGLAPGVVDIVTGEAFGTRREDTVTTTCPTYNADGDFYEDCSSEDSTTQFLIQERMDPVSYEATVLESAAVGAEVPAPAALPLLLGALGGFALLRRRG